MAQVDPTSATSDFATSDFVSRQDLRDQRVDTALLDVYTLVRGRTIAQQWDPNFKVWSRISTVVEDVREWLVQGGDMTHHVTQHGVSQYIFCELRQRVPGTTVDGF